MCECVSSISKSVRKKWQELIEKKTLYITASMLLNVENSFQRAESTPYIK